MSTRQELTRLIETNKEKYYRVAFAYVKEREEALDIVHDTIVKAIQKLDSLRDREYLETWFYRILINESISHLRKRSKLVYFDELPQSQLPVAEEADREAHMALYEAIDRLTPKLKTVVILRFFEERKLKEIAEITETNLSTTKARLYKALKLLKIDMEGLEDD